MAMDPTKLARLKALRAEVSALEDELDISHPTYGYTRDETYAMALPRGEDPYYLLPAEERDVPAPVEGPLQGVTVLDLTRILAGPHCTKMLMDMGARIIKVEHPDPTGVASGDTRPAPEYFAATSHGKESVAIDLKDDTGKAQLHALLENADVVVENYRPGVMSRLGFGWETLHEQYPRLVMCSISGFGATGPASMRPAMDTVAQALSGLMSITGLVENEPHGHGANSADVISGVHGALGVVAALYSREHDGQGRYVDIAMVDCNFSLLSHIVTRYTDNREHAPRGGGHWYRSTPLGVFQTADDPLVLIAYQPKDFITLCGVLGTDHWLEHKLFSSSSKRSRNFDAFCAALEDELSKKGRDEWIEIFLDAGIAVSQVNTIQDAIDDAQLHHRKMLVNVTNHQNDRDYTVLGNPVKISGFRDSNWRPAVPELDEHGDTIRGNARL